MFHPVVKSACSYLNCSFCPHCFFLRFSLFLPLGMMYITINQRRSQRNFRHILHKDESRKLCMIPTKKASPTLPCVGHLWERENHSEETKLRRTGATQRLYEPQPLSGALVLDCGFWVTVRSGTPNRCPSPLSLRDISPPRGESPIQIRRRFRTPHRKGHHHRFPFP